MSHDLKIGVIGAGGRGGLATHAHQPENGVRLTAACDVVAEPLTRFKEQFGRDCFTTTDYRKLLEQDLDAVFVTSPDFLHEEHAVAALEAGKSVYLEKPMAITIDGCDRILKTAMKHGRKLYLGHNMRHMAFTQKMKELIDGGAIGEVKSGWCRHFIAYGCDAYFKDWHADRTLSTGLLLQKAAHDIDILHWLCGGYTDRVVGMGNLSVYDKIQDRHAPEERGNASWSDRNWPPLSQTGLNPVLDVEDLSMMLMHLGNGVMASYQQCHYTPDAWRNYTIIGTEGRLENFGDSPGNMVVRVWNKRTGYNPYGDEQYFIGHDTGSHGGADPRIVDEFIGYLRGAAQIKTSPIAARYSVAAGYLATQSIRQGNIPLDVPPLPGGVEAYFRAS
jgi:predicted dehydrogenase